MLHCQTKCIIFRPFPIPILELKREVQIIKWWRIHREWSISIIVRLKGTNYYANHIEQAKVQIVVFRENLLVLSVLELQTLMCSECIS